MSSQNFDVVVYGSSSGAVTCAIQCAKLNRSVALISPDERIGGIQINGLGSTDIDNQAGFQNSTTLGGLNLEFRRRVSRHYGRLDRLEEVVKERIKDATVWKVESHVAEKVIREWLAEYASITVIEGRLKEEGEDRKEAVKKKGSKVEELILEDGTRIKGKLFIEASFESDLLAASQITTVIGRESASTYNESLAGVRNETLYRQMEVNVDPYIRPGDPSSGLLYGISPEPFGSPGDGDAHLQAYSYRTPLTDVSDNRIPFTKPQGYNDSHYELHLPNDKTDLIGSEGALSTDLLGMNDGWPGGTNAQRSQILQQTRTFTQGLLWFFANDASMPEHIRHAWQRFGYCKDEFADNEHFPRQLYIRDARRMLSEYTITQHTASAMNGEGQAPDPVAVACWPTDTHSARRILRDGKIHNEGFIFKDGHHRWRPFGISYRALVPRRSEAGNVLSVTCPSSSHVGYGAVRLEHTFQAIGQAVGMACDAVLGRGEEDCCVQDVRYGEELEGGLRKSGVVVDVGGSTADWLGAPE